MPENKAARPSAAKKKSIPSKKSPESAVATLTTTRRKRRKAESLAAKPNPLVTERLRLIEQSLDADKAEDIVIIDLAEKSTIADFLVIASGRNSRQLAAMAHHLEEKLTGAGVKSIAIEGLSQGEWVLLDGGDIIVHLFRPEVRKLYNLEKMWSEALTAPERLLAIG